MVRQRLIESRAVSDTCIASILDASEGIVGRKGRIHFFEAAIAVEERVATEEEGDDADGPDVTERVS